MSEPLYISDPYEKDRQAENASLPGPPQGEPRFLQENGLKSQGATCPLASIAAELSQSLVQSRRGLRRLRQSARHCRTCPQANACPSMSAFTSAIDAAITELWEEWRGSDE